jgi:hypothetical protein
LVVVWASGAAEIRGNAWVRRVDLDQDFGIAAPARCQSRPTPPGDVNHNLAKRIEIPVVIAPHLAQYGAIMVLSRTRSRHRKPGPFSRDEALTELDARTRAGRVMKGVIRQLSDQIGDATAGQRLLIQSAALKATRLALLSEQLLDGTPPSEGSDHHALAWLNSLRLDLMALGLERRERQILDLNSYLKTAAAEKPATDVAAEADAA